MKFLAHCVCAIFMLTFAGSALGQTNQRPILPDQYAEVVLRVEGMT